MYRGKVNEIPSLPRLAYLFNYDEATGLLTRRVKLHTRAKIGEEVGYLNNIGYRVVKVSGVKYLVHRIIWKMYYGYDPTRYIDHLNRDRSDNSIDNLFDGSQSSNIRNSPISSRNTSGCVGVCKLGDKWLAEIRVDGIRHRLGLFTKVEDAVKCREEENRRLINLR